MTTQESIDKFLKEKLFGECWHEIDWNKMPAEVVPTCDKCGSEDIKNKTFHDWPGFGRLWEKMQTWEDWEEFQHYGFSSAFNVGDLSFHLLLKNINPETFPRLVAEFLGWTE